MREIDLNQGFTTYVDDDDYDQVTEWNWSAVWNGHSWYVQRTTKSLTNKSGMTTVSLHRTLMNAPRGVHVDHADGNTFNNQKHNLRLATVSQNNYNIGLKPSNKSGFKGVSLKKGKWVAEIRAAGRHFYLGTFADPVDAALAYDAAAREHHGSFARTNQDLGLVGAA
jgi:hypothetical protein